MSKITKQEQSLRKAAYWRDQIDEWRRSGLSQAEYCRQSGFSLGLFNYWKRRLKVTDAEKIALKTGIVPLPVIQLSPARPSEPVVLVAGGYQIELRGDFCVTALKKLLSILGQAA